MQHIHPFSWVKHVARRDTDVQLPRRIIKLHAHHLGHATAGQFHKKVAGKRHRPLNISVSSQCVIAKTQLMFIHILEDGFDIRAVLFQRIFARMLECFLYVRSLTSRRIEPGQSPLIVIAVNYAVNKRATMGMISHRFQVSLDNIPAFVRNRDISAALFRSTPEQFAEVLFQHIPQLKVMVARRVCTSCMKTLNFF